VSSFQHIASTCWPVVWSRVAALYRELPVTSPSGWRWLSAWLVQTWVEAGAAPPTVVISGGQGAGKSTLAALLVEALGRAGVTAVGVGLDDYYLGRQAREALARAVHPLFVTRGVPGTHDVAHLRRSLTALRRPGEVLLPRFDKGTDEPCPESQWRTVAAPVETLVFEGWCLGARAEPVGQLRTPINTLERAEDADGRWRETVNRRLGDDYARLLDGSEFLMYLQVPDLDAVIRWRAAQEAQLPIAQRMNAVELRRFIAHFERLTRSLDRQLGGRCDLTVGLGPRHGIRSLGVAMSGRMSGR
jgi:D-glycerate 3-kinase